ncbi:MAG: hypothetical protein OK422_04145 [Thaumarchaeota archaeon]|nr:hypothetical protein [Nitrososphaerota archaeon]
MGAVSYVRGLMVATYSGFRHFFRPRMTLSYPNQKLDLEGPGYQYDPKTGTGKPGFKGRHILSFDNCTGCSLCAIACDGVAVAIEMQHVPKGLPKNKKDIFPAVDYGRCVPPSTPIITMYGVKPISEIRVGDRVLTHTGKFRKVTRLFCRNYTGKLYTFWTSGNPEPLTTTEDHPVLVFDGEVSWSFASEIKCGFLLTRPTISEPSPIGLQLNPELYGAANGNGSTIRQAALISRLKPSTSPYVHPEQGMVVSEVIRTETTEVRDFLVQNLEVEEDNSYVAANQSVHNCVFCALCVDPETEVATNPGIKPIKEIAIGERVLTHRGEYKPVTRIWQFSFTGLLYEIKVMGKPNPLICTVDHKILAVKRPISARLDKRLLRKTEPIEMTLPQDLKVGDYLLTPIPKRTIDLEEVRIEFKGHYETKRLNLRAEPSLFRLIGYYLSEGSTDLGGRSATFSFGSYEKSLIDDVSHLLAKYFFKKPRVQILRQHATNVRLWSSLGLKFFSQFGRGAPNKLLPDWVFFASREKQIQLVKGLFLGDGCVVNQPKQRYLNITTVSKVLANQVQLVLARLGVVSTILKEMPDNKLPAYRINIFGRWAIKLAKIMEFPFEYSPSKSSDKFLITSDYILSPIERIGTQNVSGRTVMDVTVEGDHTFVGNGVVQHNCVDACPFDALYMTNDYELSAYDKTSLKYTPDQLAIPPKTEGYTFKVKIDPEKGTATHG